MFASVGEVLKYIKERQIALVDLKIVSIGGQWLHVTLPAHRFSQGHFEEGVGYDGSSGSGFGKVESGDVSALPRPETAFVDPFFEKPTLSFLCDTITADTKEPFPSDPRTIARRAVAYLKSTGVADEAWMAPEYEFHVLEHVQVVNEPYHTSVDIRSGEIQTDGLTPPIPHKGGYLRVPPSEQLHNLRSEIVLALEELGVPIRYHHHEVGAPGQCEIEVRLTPLVQAADHALLIKYVIKNIARRHGKLATFMPKPVYCEAGNGMHVHQKLAKGDRWIFFDESKKSYAHLSEVALQYVGGLLKHGRGLAGLTNPSTNSYKRLVEGYEAPVNLFFSLANRSAAIRVPRYAIQPEQKRIEYRPPDFTGNVYLTLAAMVMAGLDGVQSKIDTQASGFGPFDVDIAKQNGDFRSRIAALPHSLADALEALRQDHDYLLKGGVFNAAFITGWVESKRERDVREVNSRPHPYEYQLYLDT